jgi:O-antigen ligase
MSKGLLFTYALTYVGSLVALFDPFVGLLIYVAFAILKPDFLWGHSTEPGNYSKVVAVAMLLGWCARGFGSWRLGGARGIVGLLLAFLGWAVVGACRSTYLSVALEEVDGLAKIVLPFLIGVTIIDSVPRLRQLAWVILLTESYIAFEMNSSYFHGYNRLWHDGFGSLDNNGAAVGMVTATGLAFFLLLHASRWWQKAVIGGCCLLLSHAVFLSFSRGAQLSLGITGFVSFLLIPKKPRHYVLFALAVAVMIQLAGPEVRERFWTTFAGGGERDASEMERLTVWAAALKNVKESPLFGVGPGHWVFVSAQQHGLLLQGRGMACHSTWIQVAAEFGVPALLILLAFYGLCIVRLWPVARRRQPGLDPWLGHFACMVIAALVGFMVAAQFVTLYRYEMPYYIALIGAVTLKLRARAVTPASETKPVVRARAWLPHGTLAPAGPVPPWPDRGGVGQPAGAAAAAGAPA